MHNQKNEIDSTINLSPIMGKLSRRDRTRISPKVKLTKQQRAELVKDILRQMSAGGLDVAKEPALRDFLSLCKEYLECGERTDVNVVINNGTHSLQGVLPSNRSEEPMLRITNLSKNS